MDKKEYLKYAENESFEFSIYENSFVTFLGKGNKKILDIFKFDKKQKNLYIDSIISTKISLEKIYRNISYVLNKDLDIFVAETVEDEIAFGLESLAKPKNQIREIINTKAIEFHLIDHLKRSPNSLGSSDKAKLKILSAIIFEPKVLILDNIIGEMNYSDKIRVVSLLKEYVNKSNIVLNFTDDIEESLYGDRIIITDIDKIIADGSTLSILKEEKLMKKTGLGLPFIVELNKYLMDYGIIKRYELDIEKLVDTVWK